MPHPEDILSICESKDKDGQSGPIQCPACGSCVGHTKHGYYSRYMPDGKDVVSVPRFKCHNRACPKVTFSILPFPFLPWVGHRLCFLLGLVDVLSASWSVRRASRDLGLTRGVIRRALKRGRQVVEWFSIERHRSRWGSSPCRSPAEHWTAFTQAFSCAIFPTQFPR
jgi:hypothetical protein